MDKNILHCDLNSFFANVELLDFPQYVDMPVAVAGDASLRHGIILAKNEIAKGFNIKTAETIFSAKKKCPKLIILEAHHKKYSYYSKKVNEIYLRFTNKVEPFGIDESWLDVTNSKNLFGSAYEIAEKIRKIIKEELGLTVSIGVSFTKVFSKLGSDYKKPDAVTVISRENFKDFLYKLPVNDMLFVGKSLKESFRYMGISTIGDLAGYDSKKLVKKFGSKILDLQETALGNSDDEVAFYGDENEIKSVGNSITFKKDLTQIRDIDLGLLELADMVATRMKNENVKAKTIQLTVKTNFFKAYARQITLPNYTNLKKDLHSTALELFKDNFEDEYVVRLLGISVSNLSFEDSKQLDLFDENVKDEKQEKAEKAIDLVRQKFGKSVIQSASKLDNNLF